MEEAGLEFEVSQVRVMVSLMRAVLAPFIVTLSGATKKKDVIRFHDDVHDRKLDFIIEK